MPSQIAPSGPECLQGWKEIALYLGRGLRTVQRYEASFGLPVRRYAGNDAGSVVAFKSDLDRWLRSKPVRRRAQAPPSKGREPSMEKLRISMEKMAQLHHDLRLLGIETLRTNMARMAQLRGEMELLRGELEGSIAALQRTTGTLWTTRAGYYSSQTSLSGLR
jgi:hypothetical protein